MGLTSLSSFQNNGLILASQTGTSNATVQATTFTNAGGISLQNNRVGDAFTINGNYVGVPGSLIALDFATLREAPIKSRSTGMRRGRPDWCSTMSRRSRRLRRRRRWCR